VLSGNAFVGRENEIRLLEAELAEASAGRRRLVTVAGDAGIGKTRAVEEFVARVASSSVMMSPPHLSDRKERAHRGGQRAVRVQCRGAP